MNILTNTDRKQIADVPSSTPKEYLKSRTVVSVPRPPATKEKTPSPPRSCSGKRPKVERERGVNTLASCWRTGHGDHRPTIICLAHHMNSSLFVLHSSLNHTPSYYNLQGYSLPSIARPLVACQSKKGRGKPCVSAARGRGFFFLYIYAVLGVFSETHRITL